ncbi:hypothetical protein EDC01DRAFT_755764 [Geopyxis carbonaria]|nr:hypothetical protein EDC01DRAFT_755764 [Geopyxis carbonaria]
MRDLQRRIYPVAHAPQRPAAHNAIMARLRHPAPTPAHLTSQPTLPTLPEEIWITIITFCDYRSILKLQQVSHAMMARTQTRGTPFHGRPHGVTPAALMPHPVFAAMNFPLRTELSLITVNRGRDQKPGRLMKHRRLGRETATEPAVTRLKVQIPGTSSVEVVNRNGVTVLQVAHALTRGMATQLDKFMFGRYWIDPRGMLDEEDWAKSMMWSSGLQWAGFGEPVICKRAGKRSTRTWVLRGMLRKGTRTTPPGRLEDWAVADHRQWFYELEPLALRYGN